MISKCLIICTLCIEGSTLKHLCRRLSILNKYAVCRVKKTKHKTTIPALSSGQTENDTSIWGRTHQLDGQNRNPNTNNRDYLDGRPTRVTHLPPLLVWQKITLFAAFFLAIFPMSLYTFTQSVYKYWLNLHTLRKYLCHYFGKCVNIGQNY